MRSENGSAFARVPFSLTAEQLAAIDQLRLDMKAEDGFVAYLNGVKVASLGAFFPRLGLLADGATRDSDAIQFVAHNLSLRRGAEVGTNILAFQLLNQSEGSSDILCMPRLVGITFPDAPGDASAASSTPARSHSTNPA